jgi:hypothetical protein
MECFSVIITITVTASITITTINFRGMAARPRRLNSAQALVSIQEWIDAERRDNDDEEAADVLTSESEFDAGEEVDNVELNEATSSSAEDETTHDEEPDECISKDKTLRWSSIPLQPPKGRRGKHNIVRERCSVTIDKALLADPRMCVEHFLDEKFMTTVLQHTNEELERRRQKRADQQLVCHEDFDLLEMEACIGLLILTGVMSSKGESSELMWSQTFGHACLRKKDIKVENQCIECEQFVCQQHAEKKLICKSCRPRPTIEDVLA